MVHQLETSIHIFTQYAENFWPCEELVFSESFKYIERELAYEFESLLAVLADLQVCATNCPSHSARKNK